MKTKSSGQRRKHVPLRTCIVCRGKQPKRELIRIVRTPDGAIEIDPRGKRSGRGAYVCRSPDCWSAALHSGKLGHALRSEVGAEDLATLRAMAASLFEEKGTRDDPEPDRRPA